MLAALLLIAAAPAIAVDCRDPVDQRSMNLCSGRDFGRADAEMNRVWKQTLAALRAKDRAGADQDGRPSFSQALLASQRAWLGFRDAQCLIEGYDYRGGSAEGMRATGCKTRLTEERTRQLKALASPN